jgi:hypothetical protein
MTPIQSRILLFCRTPEAQLIHKVALDVNTRFTSLFDDISSEAHNFYTSYFSTLYFFLKNNYFGV